MSKYRIAEYRDHFKIEMLDSKLEPYYKTSLHKLILLQSFREKKYWIAFKMDYHTKEEAIKNIEELEKYPIYHEVNLHNK